MPVPVVIALGGNLGDVRAAGHAALSQLGQVPGIIVEQISQWYSTEPVGCEGRFLNAAARLTSELTPTQLLLQMHEIEAQHGRVRTGHWLPRPLDLDLILFGEWRIEHPLLKVPHPAAWCRRFVLDPGCEVAGTMTHPSFGLTIGQLRSRLLPRPLAIAWSEGLPRNKALAEAIQARFGSIVRWTSTGESSVVRFVPPSPDRVTPFEVAVPNDSTKAQRTVIDTLTAMLDEPSVAG